jgi:transcriptional antiterminator NusG
MTMISETPSCPWPRRAEAPARGERWHIVCATVDDRLRELLKRQGYKFVYPELITMRPTPRRFLSHAQRKAGVQPMRPHREPLFPGYPFVRFDQERARWHDLFKLAGVRGMVCNGDLPVPVPAELVEQIEASMIDGAVPASTTVSQLFDVGELVRVADGPFASFNAVIEAMPNRAIGDLDESDRVRLLVDIFGRPTRVDLEMGQIEKL